MEEILMFILKYIYFFSNLLTVKLITNTHNSGKMSTKFLIYKKENSQFHHLLIFSQLNDIFALHCNCQEGNM
jgi:hypothetical protein